jgi:signal peptidase I
MKRKKPAPESAVPPPAPVEPAKKKKRKHDPDKPQGVAGFVAEWTVTILLLVFGITFVLQSFVVPTSSMEDTILIGDHMFVDKLAFSPPGPVSKYLLPYTPVKRGDVIVFRFPLNIKENYIKRVIGVPGDRIRIANKQVFLNGRLIEEPYVVHKTSYYDSYRDNFPSEPNTNVSLEAREMLSNNVVNGELVVPPRAYFAMGDNRDNSLDSRYWGFVPQENVIGKPVIIFWSYDAPTDRLADPNFISLEHILDLVQNFFSKTRWSRTFQLIKGYGLQ